MKTQDTPDFVKQFRESCANMQYTNWIAPNMHNFSFGCKEDPTQKKI